MSERPEEAVKRGLIVDDQAAFAEIVEELMTERLAKLDCRFRFDTRTEAAEAIRLLEDEPPGTFELVLTDILFPSPDRPDAGLEDQNPLGHDVIEAASKAGARVIVGFTQMQTARMQELKKAARDLGADLFVGRNDFTTTMSSSAVPEIASLLRGEEPKTSPDSRIDPPREGEDGNRRQVAVIHGANDAAREAMFSFLDALDLIPIDFRQAISWTGEGSPPNASTLLQLIQVPQAIVVLLTPDEDVALHPSLAELRTQPDSGRQPRPNVYVEMGMALALKPERTILVEVGKVRVPSDIEARAAVRLDNSEDKRDELVQRLEDAGCAVRKKKGAYDAGDFDGATTEMND